MKECPKCHSKNISKEKWSDVVPSGAYGLAGSSVHNDTGDLICNDCNYSSAPSSFEKK